MLNPKNYMDDMPDVNVTVKLKYNTHCIKNRASRWYKNHACTCMKSTRELWLLFELLSTKECFEKKAVKVCPSAM